MEQLKRYYLTKDESTILKGLAIVFVVIGHNPNLRSPESQEFIYSFHIYLFFILPFFYNRTISNIKQLISKTFIKTIVPYFWFYSLAFVVANIILNHKDNSMYSYLLGFFNINGETPGTICESTYLWFLPAYFGMIVLWIIGEKNKYIKWGLILLSCFLSLDMHFTWHVVYSHVPFFLARALFYYFYAQMTLFTAKMLSPKYDYIGGCLFMIFTAYYATYGNNMLYSLLMPCVSFNAFVFFIRKFRLPLLVKQFGEYSLFIYVFHMYFYFVVEHLTANRILIYTSTILSLFGSMYFAIILRKQRRIYKLLFP